MKSAVKDSFWLELMDKTKDAYDVSGFFYTFAGVALEKMSKAEVIAAYHHDKSLLNSTYNRVSK